MRQLSYFTLYSIFLEQRRPYKTELLIILLLQKVFKRRQSMTLDESSTFGTYFYCFGVGQGLIRSDFLQEMLPLEILAGGSMEKSYDFASERSDSMLVSRSMQIFSNDLSGIFMILVPFKLALAQRSLFFTLLFTQNRPKSLPFSSDATSYMFSPNYLKILTCPSSRQYIASTSSPLLQAKELKLSPNTQHLSRKASFSMLFMPRMGGRSRKYNFYRISTVLQEMLQRVKASLEENSLIPSGMTWPDLTRTTSPPLESQLINRVTSSAGREIWSRKRKYGMLGSMGVVRRVFARQSLRRERSQSLSKCLKKGRSLILMKRKGSLIESVLPIFMRILLLWKETTANSEYFTIDVQIKFWHLDEAIIEAHTCIIKCPFYLSSYQTQSLLIRQICLSETFCHMPLSNLIRPFPSIAFLCIQAQPNIYLPNNNQHQKLHLCFKGTLPKPIPSALAHLNTLSFPSQKNANPPTKRPLPTTNPIQKSPLPSCSLPPLAILVMVSCEGGRGRAGEYQAMVVLVILVIIFNRSWHMQSPRLSLSRSDSQSPGCCALEDSILTLDASTVSLRDLASAEALESPLSLSKLMVDSEQEEGEGERCEDFHVMGFCLRGAKCALEHRTTPLKTSSALTQKRLLHNFPEILVGATLRRTRSFLQ